MNLTVTKEVFGLNLLPKTYYSEIFVEFVVAS